MRWSRVWCFHRFISADICFQICSRHSAFCCALWTRNIRAARLGRHCREFNPCNMPQHGKDRDRKASKGGISPPKPPKGSQQDRIVPEQRSNSPTSSSTRANPGTPDQYTPQGFDYTGSAPLHAANLPAQAEHEYPSALGKRPWSGYVENPALAGVGQMFGEQPRRPLRRSRRLRTAPSGTQEPTTSSMLYHYPGVISLTTMPKQTQAKRTSDASALTSRGNRHRDQHVSQPSRLR